MTFLGGDSELWKRDYSYVVEGDRLIGDVKRHCALRVATVSRCNLQSVVVVYLDRSTLKDKAQVMRVSIHAQGSGLPKQSKVSVDVPLPYAEKLQNTFRRVNPNSIACTGDGVDASSHPS